MLCVTISRSDYNLYQVVKFSLRGTFINGIRTGIAYAINSQKHWPDKYSLKNNLETSYAVVVAITRCTISHLPKLFSSFPFSISSVTLYLILFVSIFRNILLSFP